MSRNGVDWSTFGGRFSWLLDRDPRPQKEIARALGVAGSRVSEWKRASNPELETLQRIARVFPRASVGWLVTGGGDPIYEGAAASAKIAEIRRIIEEPTSADAPPDRPPPDRPDDEEGEKVG